ncbi:MAG: four helix bundle protein [bacterium]
MKFDIRERAKKFAVRVIGLINKLPKEIASQEIGRQLIRSGCSVGANLEEADAASSRKDFFYKVAISYKEARESRYWLEIILETKLLHNQSNIKEAETLQVEAVELSKILFSIMKGRNK